MRPVAMPSWATALHGRAAALRADEAIMKVGSNTAWLMGDRIVRAGIGFVVGALVARHLGPAEFGHLAYVLAFIFFFQVVTPLGADMLVVAGAARTPEAAPSLLGSIVVMRVAAGILAWIAAIALTAVLSPGEPDTLAMTAIAGGVLVFQAADTIDLWFQSQSENRRTVKAKFIASLLTNGVKVALVFAQAPVWAFAAAFTLDFALAVPALLIAYRRFPTPGGWHFDRRQALDLLRQGWPFMLSALSIVVYIRIDQIMLKTMRDTRESGLFAAALPLSQIWQMIPMTLATGVAPLIARRRAEGMAPYEATLVKTFRIFTLSALGVSLLTFAAAPLLVPLVYGPQYAETVAILRIHVFTNVFVAIGIAQGLWIANERAGRLLLTQTLTGATVAIVGNLFAIPVWGALGAAAVAVLAQATSGLFVNAVLAPRLFMMQLGLTPRALT